MYYLITYAVLFVIFEALSVWLRTKYYPEEVIIRKKRKRKHRAAIKNVDPEKPKPKPEEGFQKLPEQV